MSVPFVPPLLIMELLLRLTESFVEPAEQLSTAQLSSTEQLSGPRCSLSGLPVPSPALWVSE